MYYATWLVLVAISLAVSIAAFIWGLRSGQFSDPERARYLPLGSDLLSQPAVAATHRKKRAQTTGLIFVVLICLAGFAAALALGIHHR